MSSFLNASTEVKTSTTLSPHITLPQVLSLLHNNPAMLDLNPIIKSHTLLPPSASTAFFKAVAAENKPPATGPEPSTPIPVFQVIESMGGNPADGAQGGSWRGGWATRFIPDEITYQTSMQNTEDGLISITHAPMGVHSVTVWSVREPAVEGAGLVLEKTGKVTSNRMLMTFIRTTLQESYEKLARDFVEALEKHVAPKRADSEAEVEVEKVT